MAAVMVKKCSFFSLFLFAIFIELDYAVGNTPDNALNFPQLLLPYAAKGLKPTTFLLRALRGCFKWTSTKPHIASLTMVNAISNGSLNEIEDENTCSQSALVKVKLKSQTEDATVILAEEEGTGIILRCDVFVDYISNIAITTTARELLIGESPEVFEVHAYDKEGNLFSALGSTTFEWNILPVPHIERVDSRSVLQMLWFHDSVYETSPEIYQLEGEHLRGSSVLIEGISTGDAIVSAKLSHPDNKVVPSSRVKVTVLDNVILVPPDVYILVHHVVYYSAFQLRRGKQKNIILPSEQYSLKVVDEDIGQLNESYASVCGLSIGATKLQLIDKNMANLSSARVPTATIHVVNPGKIGFAINPGKVWILQTGKEYYMHVRLFDDDNNRIRIDNNTIFQSMLLHEFFNIHFKSVNGSYFYVQAKKVGATVLNATLKGVQYGDEIKISQKDLFGEQHLEIYDPVTVTPEDTLFPWDPSLSGTQNYQYQLTAGGGSGSYLWSNIDTVNKIAVVNKKGVVSAGVVMGVATIKVSDIKNHNHFALAKVHVLPPKEMLFIEHAREALVGEKLNLALSVAAYLPDGKEKSFFKDCRKMKLQLVFTDAAIFKVVPSEVEIPDEGCTSIILEGLSVGYTTLTATYTYGDVILHASIVIAAYKPVTVTDPFEFATVTLGSKKRIVADGGPLPWILDSSRYYHIMSAEEEEWVKINPVMTSDENHVGKSEHLFDVSCIQLGVQMLTIVVFNKPTAKNKFPAQASATTRFLCTPPAAMKLVPLITLPMIDGNRRTLESCKDDNKRIPVLNDRELRLNLMIYDSNGNLFDDASSLNIEWSTDDPIAAEFYSKIPKYEARKAVPLKSNSGIQVLEVLQVHRQQLPVIVTATITSYKDNSKEQIINPPISTHLHMLTVPKPDISPNSLNMLVHPLNQLKLAVSGGSQNFILRSSGHSEVKFSPTNITVTPITEGKEIIYLHDACLDLEHPAKAHLYLSDIYALQLVTIDKVEIGQTIEAKCQASDIDGNLLSIIDSAINEINLMLKMSYNILDVGKVTVLDLTEKKYILKGKSVGITTLTCEATQLSRSEINSRSVDVQVFSPIELDPKYVLLIVGSNFQIHSRGGPRPHSTTVYSCKNETVADINQLGLVTANVIGKTLVTGKAVGADSLGKAKVYSQDQTIVEVIQLKGFKISLKSSNLITDTEIGVLSVGITDEGPFTFATSPPYLQFHWSTSNHKVAVVESLHYKAGVSVTSDKDFRAVIRVLSPGRVAIKLSVQVLSNHFSQVHEHAQLDDEIQVQVFEKLELKYPKSGALLLPNHGASKLQTNKDQIVSVTYEVLSPCPASLKDSVLTIFDNGQITASSSGIANVLITAHEDFGFNQTALVQIEVKPVASITLVSHAPFVINGKDHPSFPIGSNIEFGITLHDNVARKFDVAKIPLMHTTTRTDVVHVIPNAENSTLIVRASNVGETILKVWDKENPSVADYIRISISEGIVPPKATVVLGGTICFSAGVSSGNGMWTSSGNSISIDKESGLAIGLSLGSTMIHYQEDSYSTYTEVTVVAPTHIPIIKNGGDLSISNSENKRLFSLSFDPDAKSENKCPEAHVSLVSENIPFSCFAHWNDDDNLAVNDVFSIEAVYINGNAACSLTSNSLSAEKEKTLSLGERILILYVKLKDKKTQKELTSAPVNIRFIPKFHVEVSSIDLSSKHTKQIIKIFGSSSDVEDLEISSDPNIITITKFTEHIEVSANDIPTADVDTSITFYSPITKHSSVVSVAIKGEPIPVVAPSCPVVQQSKEPNTGNKMISSLLGESSLWILAYTIILATIIILIVIYHFFAKRRPIAPVLVATPYGPNIYGNSPYSNGQVLTPYLNKSLYNSSGYPSDRQLSPVPTGTLFSVSQ